VTGSLPTVTLFLALLAVVAQASTAGAIVLAGARAIPGGVGRGAAQAFQQVRAEVAPYARGLAACVAAVCTAGSLYLSEIANFPPCRLCWYQRYCMYPLVVLLAVAQLRRGSRLGDRVALGAAALAVVGISISTWHMAIERFPSLESAQSCDPSNPCSIIWVERLGYQTIPTMAWSGFALILTLLALDRRTSHGNP
jgi:disulfide bond formation protein DsbB